MKILVLDPGLSCRKGHNAAIIEELDAELRDRRGVRLSVAGAASLEPAEFAHLAACVRPAFRIDGYWQLAGRHVHDAATLGQIRRCVDEDLAALRLQDWDVVLMHTVYPLHLEGLARCLPRLRAARLLGGLLMPPGFWAAEPQAATWLGDSLQRSVQRLHAGADAVFYTETGRYDFGGASMPTPVLLPPVARATQALMAELAERAERPRPDALRFGFFGSPFGSKGFGHLCALAERGLPAHVRVVVRLPQGHEALCGQLARLGPQIDATSRPMSNADFLREMAAVDVILAAYDPTHYGQKMSGIVPESISLGKPLVVSDGCDALVDFLDRHAPRSFACCPYTADGMAAALALPGRHWLELAGHARASAPLMREMKNAARYLALAGAGAQAEALAESGMQADAKAVALKGAGVQADAMADAPAGAGMKAGTIGAKEAGAQATEAQAAAFATEH